MIDYTFKPAAYFESAISELYHILTMLRSPEGCPWDKKQTGRSMAQSVMNETYEYIDALDACNLGEQKEEIGDVLMTVLMILEIHQQDGDFEPVDAINGICEKLVRRHPHVFTDNAHAKDDSDVMKIWSNVKKNVEGREDHSEDDLFSNIPKSEPLVEQAYQIQKKLENLGFDWKDQKGVYDKVIEELEEVRTADNEQDREMEIGDLLFTVINLSRFYKIHPETALYRNTQKVKKRFNLLMKICKERNIELKTENADQMNEVWNEIKKLEH